MIDACAHLKTVEFHCALAVHQTTHLCLHSYTYPDRRRIGLCVVGPWRDLLCEGSLAARGEKFEGEDLLPLLDCIGESPP
jgi:hypothetical protein